MATFGYDGIALPSLYPLLDAVGSSDVWTGIVFGSVLLHILYTYTRRSYKSLRERSTEDVAEPVQVLHGQRRGVITFHANGQTEHDHLSLLVELNVFLAERGMCLCQAARQPAQLQLFFWDLNQIAGDLELTKASNTLSGDANCFVFLLARISHMTEPECWHALKKLLSYANISVFYILDEFDHLALGENMNALSKSAAYISSLFADR